MKLILVLTVTMVLFFSPNFTNAQQKDRNGKPVDFAQSSTDHLTKVLKLDGFQSAAIKNFMDDYKKELENLTPLQIPEEAKLEKYNAANEKLESKILSVLNKEQVQLYQDEKNKKNKKKKKGKDKNEDKKDE